MCGENGPEPGKRRRASGSSPRVRGKRASAQLKAGEAGLIPACAGKTPRDPRRSSLGPAHPRVCGENSRPPQPWYGTAGSSPRVRGKPRPLIMPWMNPRLIPACAGKTSSYERATARSGAHPRVCGENPRASLSSVCSEGSSPRVRGKLDRRDRLNPSAGLIPACAGKTDRRSDNCAAMAAHPRVCGENDIA